MDSQEKKHRRRAAFFQQKFFGGDFYPICEVEGLFVPALSGKASCAPNGDIELVVEGDEPADLRRIDAQFKTWDLQPLRDYTLERVISPAHYIIKTSDHQVLERIAEGEANFRKAHFSNPGELMNPPMSAPNIPPAQFRMALDIQLGLASPRDKDEPPSRSMA